MQCKKSKLIYIKYINDPTYALFIIVIVGMLYLILSPENDRPSEFYFKIVLVKFEQIFQMTG